MLMVGGFAFKIRMKDQKPDKNKMIFFQSGGFQTLGNTAFEREYYFVIQTFHAFCISKMWHQIWEFSELIRGIPTWNRNRNRNEIK